MKNKEKQRKTRETPGSLASGRGRPLPVAPLYEIYALGLLWGSPRPIQIYQPPEVATW